MIFPEFCLERWQSLRDWRARYNLSESGVEPLTYEELVELVGMPRGVVLGYGMTKGLPRLREELAVMHGVGPEEVLVTSGGAEANFVTTLALVGPGDRAVVVMPTYMQIPGILRGIGAVVDKTWIKYGEGLDEEELKRKVARGVKAVFVTNPNNPTGYVLSEGERKLLVDLAEDAGAYLVVDEVYRGLEHEGPETPTFAKHYDKAVVTGSLSKTYGLPGLRIGWVVGPEDVVNGAWAVKDYTTISPPLLDQHLAVAVLEKRDYFINRSRTIVRRNFAIFGEYVKARPYVKWWNTKAAAFSHIYVGGDTLKLAEEIFEETGVLVNPGECFEMKGYLRVGLGWADENRLREALDLFFWALDKKRP